MSKPCDFGRCDISRCTDKDCTSLNEDVTNGAAVVECSKTRLECPPSTEKLKDQCLDLRVPRAKKEKSLYACGKLCNNKLLWMKGGIRRTVG